MSPQITYGYKTAMGEAGGIIDLAPYAIDSFSNEAETGALKFGVGVVKGTAAGHQVNLPNAGSVSGDFEGIVVNRRTSEYDMEGKIHIRKYSTVGVMRYGRIYGRVAKDAEPAYGDAVYMVVSGDEAGYFTNVAEDGVALNGRFLGPIDAAVQIAAIELLSAPVIVSTTANAKEEESNG